MLSIYILLGFGILQSTMEVNRVPNKTVWHFRHTFTRRIDTDNVYVAPEYSGVLYTQRSY